MIKIISMDGDHSTDEVIDWLTYYKIDFERLNISSDIENTDLNYKLSIGSEGNNSNIKTTWIRKLGFFTDLKSYKDFYSEQDFSISNYGYLELSALRKALLLSETKWLCPPISLSRSKIELLTLAAHQKIDFPETHITNNKKELLRLFNLYDERIIIKSLNNAPLIRLKEEDFMPLTKKIYKKDFANISDTFFPTLVQREIEKEFEIRSFYLDGIFFSAAIFSQLDEQTKIDFRNYNYNRPNRLVPYNLPADLENKLRAFSQTAQINTGSFDIIKGKDGKYYFLEVNQVGQFGMLSKPCNFQLEKRISLQLMQTWN